MIEEKLKIISRLSRETIGGGFQLIHNDAGGFKFLFKKQIFAPNQKEAKMYRIEDFEEMLDDMIQAVETNRGPAVAGVFETRTTTKPYTLFKNVF